MGGEGGGNKLVLELEEIPGHPPPPTKNNPGVRGHPCFCCWLAEVASAWIYLST